MMRAPSCLALAVLLGWATPLLAASDPLLSAGADFAEARAEEAALPVGAGVQARFDVLARAVAAAALAERAGDSVSAFDRAEALLAAGAVAPADGSLHAWAAVSLGIAGQPDRARRTLAEAGRLVDAGPGQDSAAAALLEFARGSVAWAGDDLAGAVAAHRRATELARAHLGPADVMTLMFEQVYVSRLITQDNTAGIAALREAELHLLGRVPESHPLWVPQLNNQMQADFTRGRFVDAVRLGDRLVDLIARVHGPSDLRLFSVIQMLAMANAGLPRLDVAEAQVRQAFAIAEANPGVFPQGDIAMNHDLLGTMILYQGRPAQAAESFRAGLAAMAGIDRDDIRWPYIELHLARALSLMGHHAEAVERARRAMPGIRAKMPVGHPNLRETEVVTAMIEARAGNGAAAHAALAPMAAGSATHLLDIFVRERELAYLVTNSKAVFESYAAIALTQGQAEEGWRYAQLSGLSELAAASSRIRYPGDDGRFAALLDAIAEARRAEARAREATTAGGDPAALGAARDRTEALEARLETEFSAYRDVLRPRPLTIEQARAEVAPDAAYIIPLSLEDRTLVLAMTREELAWDETPGPWFELRELARRLRASLDAGVIVGSDGADPFDAEAAHAIHQRVFTGRIRAALAGKSTLVFLGNGPLAAIPPSVLLTRPLARGREPAWLLRDFAVAVSPGLGLGALDRPAASGGFAGIGDPLLGEQPAGEGEGAPFLRAGTVSLDDIRKLPPLPAAGEELEAMARVLGKGRSVLLRGAEATEARLRGTDLSGFGVIAFATHGLVSGEVRGLDEPALVLTPPDVPANGDDGLLRASEVSELRLAADWVILSACNTGGAAGTSRPAYSGLARAFRLAGARSVLLSHWPLRDDVARLLTVGAVSGAARGLSRAEALRRAQLRVMGEARLAGAARPAVWASLILMED